MRFCQPDLVIHECAVKFPSAILANVLNGRQLAAALRPINHIGIGIDDEAFLEEEEQEAKLISERDMKEVS